MFRDKQLSKFVEDQSDPHPERLAQWIAEKMTGKPIWSSTLSSRSRDQPYDRQSAHYKAWNSKRREPSRRGSHFKLDDAVIWMRLNFWACRKEGIDKHHPEFFEWYIKFISHFVAVYERRAPPTPTVHPSGPLMPQTLPSMSVMVGSCTMHPLCEHSAHEILVPSYYLNSCLTTLRTTYNTLDDNRMRSQ